MYENFIGKKVIVRSSEAGVFFGTLVAKEGQEVILSNARRIWYWEGACTISELALHGTATPDKCKITVAVEEIGILKVIEIIPCTSEAIKNILNVPEWQY